MFCQSTCVWAGCSFIGTIPVIYLLAQYSSHVGYEFTSRIQRICFKSYTINQYTWFSILTQIHNSWIIYHVSTPDDEVEIRPERSIHPQDSFANHHWERWWRDCLTLLARFSGSSETEKRGANMRQKYFYKRRQLTVLFYDDRVVDPLENFNE